MPTQPLPSTNLPTPAAWVSSASEKVWPKCFPPPPPEILGSPPSFTGLHPTWGLSELLGHLPPQTAPSSQGSPLATDFKIGFRPAGLWVSEPYKLPTFWFRFCPPDSCFFPPIAISFPFPDPLPLFSSFPTCSSQAHSPDLAFQPLAYCIFHHPASCFLSLHPQVSFQKRS